MFSQYATDTKLFQKLYLPLFSKCVLCKTPTQKTLCCECFSDIEYPPLNVCVTCGKPLDFDYEIETGEPYSCGECVLNPPDFDALRFALSYEGSARKLLHGFKFEGRRFLARPLAVLAKKPLKIFFEEYPNALVIPVPLAVGRLFSRGYNPAYLIAKEFCEMFSLNMLDGALRRTRTTKLQYGLNSEERRKNVRGAFSVRDYSLITGKHIVLFDDILTTGATITECTKALKKAKPQSIRVATLCRTARN